MAIIKQFAVLALFVTLGGCLRFAVAGPGGRIVGGENAAEGEFPFLASVLYLYNGNLHHICGGSVISDNAVLTAAHCVVDESGTQPQSADLFSIGVGANDRRQHIIYNVSKIIVHEGYNRAVLLNDLAIVKPTEPLQLGVNVQPIALATQEVPDGNNVIACGWGLETDGGSTLPYLLQCVTVKKISKFSCFLKIFLYEDSVLCLDHPNGKGVCNGDSGGPAIYGNELVGGAQFVIKKCALDKPDGFANVFFHRQWIVDNMV